MNTSPNKINSALEELLRTDNKTLSLPFKNTADLLSKRNFIAAMLKIEKDEVTLQRAIADPKGYFEGEGVSLPPGTKVTAAQAEGKAKGKVTIPEQCFEILWLIEVCIGGEAEGEVKT